MSAAHLGVQPHDAHDHWPRFYCVAHQLDRLYRRMVAMSRIEEYHGLYAATNCGPSE